MAGTVGLVGSRDDLGLFSEPRGALEESHKEAIRQSLVIPYEAMKSRSEFEQFYQGTMAPFLLNQVELIANGERFLIKEIEFYFTSTAHPDPFTHCQTIQESSLLWYFHRSGKSYKSGCVCAFLVRYD